MVPEAVVTPAAGAVPAEGLRVKLAEGFVRKPVDAPVPASWVPLFMPYGALDETRAEETGGPTTGEDGDGPVPAMGVAVLDVSAIRTL